MITVRFPSGFSVQYNDLTAMKWGSDGTIQLYRDCAGREAGKGWLVTVPKEALVEFIQPCRTYNAANEKQLERLESEVSSLKRTVSRKLKAKA